MAETLFLERRIEGLTPVDDPLELLFEPLVRRANNPHVNIFLDMILVYRPPVTGHFFYPFTLLMFAPMAVSFFSMAW